MLLNILPMNLHLEQALGTCYNRLAHTITMAELYSDKSSILRGLALYGKVKQFKNGVILIL